MNIVVCVKQVPDPNTPASQFKVDEAKNKVIPPSGIAPTINQYCENAVEAAVRIKEADGVSKITVLSVGGDTAKDAVKKAISMGCDAGAIVSDAGMEDADAYQTAVVLAAAIQKLGGADLVLCGRQASDWDQAQVPQGLAEILGYSSVSPVGALALNGGALQAKRVVDDGFETLSVPTPAVLAISNEANTPRYPTLKNIMAASRVKIDFMTAGDLGVAPSRKVKLLRLYVPKVESQVEWIGGETPEELAQNLARRLREEKIV